VGDVRSRHPALAPDDRGFGIHTFRLVDAKGASTFVKFHWRPKIGLQSVLWTRR